MSLGLRTSLEGFHDQIVLEMLSQVLVFEIFLLLDHDFHSLSSSIPIVFGAHLLVVHRVLQSNYFPVAHLPGELMLTSYHSFLEFAFLHEPW